MPSMAILEGRAHLLVETPTAVIAHLQNSSPSITEDGSLAAMGRYLERWEQDENIVLVGSEFRVDAEKMISRPKVAYSDEAGVERLVFRAGSQNVGIGDSDLLLSNFGRIVEERSGKGLKSISPYVEVKYQTREDEDINNPWTQAAKVGFKLEYMQAGWGFRTVIRAQEKEGSDIARVRGVAVGPETVADMYSEIFRMIPKARPRGRPKSVKAGR